MNQIIALLIGAAALAAGVEFVLHQAKESGRAECRAEHIEAARMDELRRRDRGDKAAVAHEQRKAATAERERTVVREVERIVERPVYRTECVDADGLAILAGDIAQRAAATGSSPPASRTGGESK